MKDKIIEEILATFGKMTDPSLMQADTANNLKNLVTMATSSVAFTGLQVIAGSLIAFYFLIHLVQTTMKDRSDPDAIFKDLALCCLYAAIVANLGMLVINLADVCSNLVTVVQGGISGLWDGLGQAGNNFDTATFKQTMKDKNLIVLILDACLYMVVGNLAAIIIQVIAKVAVYTIDIELVIRTILLPVGIAQLPDDGWRGPGGRYIKAFCGCFLQLAVVAAALQSYQILCLNAMSPDNPDTVFVSILAAGFAVAGLCMKASAIAREVAGA